jgi:3-oxoadipate enol-lactonase
MNPTIVWIHGFPLSSAIYEKQHAIPGFQHVMPDLPGFGSSSASRHGLTMTDYARVVLDDLDERGIEQAIFAGLSMGGYVCFAVARLAPERIAGLILIDTRETPDTDEARKGRYETIDKVRQQGVAPVVDSMFPKMLTPHAPDEMKKRVRQIMSSSSPDGVISALRAIAERPDSSDLLPKITAPTLIVVGAEDTITPPADAERMAKAMPHATLVKLAGAAHLSNFEKWEEFNAAVARQYPR